MAARAGLQLPAAPAPPRGRVGRSGGPRGSRFPAGGAPRRGASGGRGAGGRGAPSGAGGLSPRPAPRSGPRVGRRSGPAGSSVRPSPPLALRLPLTRREDGCRTPGPQLLPLRGALLRPRTLLISPAGTTRGPSGGDEGPRDGTAPPERRQHGERAGACGVGSGPARRWVLPCPPRGPPG